MSRTLTKVIIAATLFGFAFAWWLRDPRGSIIAHSTSPDGRWRILVYEHTPMWPTMSPCLYTFSLSSTQSGPQPVADFTHDNDSAALNDFQFDWSPESATVLWGDRHWSVRADTTKQPILWREAK